MIPLRLQEGLKARMNNVFASHQYKRPAKLDEEEDQFSNVNIYEQNLPVKKSEDDSPFPFVLVQLRDGSQPDQKESDHLVNVSIIVGMYDIDDSNQGYRDVSLTINKIFESLSKKPIIDGVFNLDTDSELTWSISDEETFPFYFGAIGATFVAPKFKREDLEAFC